MMNLIEKYLGEVKKTKKPQFKEGDTVMVADDALQQHARSVPAHMGYTTAEFSWRDTIRKSKGKKGKITRVFPSGNVNVDFGEGLIGMDSSMLVKVK